MKEKINGLSSEEVQERINDGKVNVTKKDNLKSNWRIIFDNVFTLFNLYNLIIAIALVCVKAYTNTFFFFYHCNQCNYWNCTRNSWKKYG